MWEDGTIYEPTVVELRKMFSMDASTRVKYFLKRVAWCGAAWGVYDEGWFALEDAKGSTLFAAWPALAFAERYMEAFDLEGKAMPMTVEAMLGDFGQGLSAHGGGYAVFPNLDDQAPVLPAEEFHTLLEEELEGYSR